jgi:serine/threonine protein kinase
MTWVRAAHETLQEWLDRIVRDWPVGVPFDARAILAELPEFRGNTSLVLDLAYEEFCQEEEAGRAPLASRFAARFPEVETSLRDLLDAHRRLHRDESAGLRNRAVDWPVCGETILDFALQRELGRGVHSRVFLARERSLGDRTVVVKVCVGGDHEASLLGRLVHPHVVPVPSVGRVPNSRLFTICMPYAGEVTLHEAVRRAFEHAEGRPETCAAITARLAAAVERAGGCDPGIERKSAPRDRDPLEDGYLAFVASTGVKLAEALEHAHRSGYLHCDVKPSNVLLTPDGEPLMLDFNLARVRSADEGRRGGTLPFMAPEQLRLVADGTPAAVAPFGRGSGVLESLLLGDDFCGGIERPVGERIDERTDVFGLAATLYHALANAAPFDAGVSLADVSLAEEYARRRVPAVGPDCGDSELGRRLIAVIRSGLAFDPADRPASMAEFAAALRNCLPRRVADRPRRSRLLRTSTMVACSLLLVPLVLAWNAGRNTRSVAGAPGGAASSGGLETSGSGPAAAVIPVATVPAAGEVAIPSRFDVAAEYEAAVRAFGREEYATALDHFATLVQAEESALEEAGIPRGPCLHAAIVAAVLSDRLGTLEPGLRERLEAPVGDELEVLGPEVGGMFVEVKRDLQNADTRLLQRLLIQKVRPRTERELQNAPLILSGAALYALASIDESLPESVRTSYRRDSIRFAMRALGDVESQAGVIAGP